MAKDSEKDHRGLIDPVWKIVAEPKSIFTLDSAGGHISWRGIERDMAIFSQVLKILEQSSHLDDEQFLAQELETIEVLLDQSSLFKGLNSPHIAVSKAHNGITPKEHSINVLRKLQTHVVSTQVRTTLRFSALFHDVGKASCAGLSKEKVNQILAGQKPPWDRLSHPNHDKISTLVIQKIRKELTTKSFDLEDTLSIDWWDNLEFIVLHHHLIPNIFSKHKTTTLEASVELINNFKNTQLLTILIGLYLLNLADVDSNDFNRKWLADNSSSFGVIFRALELDLSDKELQTLFYVYFKGTSFVLANNLQLESGSISA